MCWPSKPGGVRGKFTCSKLRILLVAFSPSGNTQNPGWIKSIYFKLVSSSFYFWYLIPHHYLWKHFWFCTNLTANVQLILGHLTGNLEEAPLSSYKKAFEKKTGSVSHRCSQKNIQRPMLQTSQCCHHHHKSNTSDLPHLFLLLHQNFSPSDIHGYVVSCVTNQS